MRAFLQSKLGCSTYRHSSSAIIHLGCDLVHATEFTFVFDSIKRCADRAVVRRVSVDSYDKSYHPSCKIKVTRLTGGQQAVLLQQDITDMWLLLAQALHSLSCARVSRRRWHEFCGLFSEFFVASRQDFQTPHHVLMLIQRNENAARSSYENVLRRAWSM